MYVIEIHTESRPLGQDSAWPPRPVLVENFDETYTKWDDDWKLTYNGGPQIF